MGESCDVMTGQESWHQVVKSVNVFLRKCSFYAIGNGGHQKVFELGIKDNQTVLFMRLVRQQTLVEHGSKEGEPTVKENNEYAHHDSSKGVILGEGFFMMRAGDKVQSYGVEGVRIQRCPEVLG